mgnify:CR=1 FL=1|tara:strand:+ start:433 stop:663 length:231 start_codon:yes stop_codon:yes gene_type:complete
MKIATVGKIQKNFSEVLRNIKAGEEITIIKRGRPVAKLTALGPKKNIKWPDFLKDAVKLKGKQVSKIVIDSRKDRF